MDYEKAYKEALVRAKQGLPLDEVFPELKESEDERIRKEIIEHLNWALERGSLPNDVIQSKRAGDWIFWLEKQKEQQPNYSPLCNTIKDKIREYIANHFIADRIVKTDIKSIVKAMEEGVRLGMEKQKPAEWSEADNRRLNSLIFELKRTNHMIDCYTTTFLIDWLKDIPKRFTVQPKQEWSEEDRVGYEEALWCVERVRICAKSEIEMGSVSLAEKWIKSHRPQKGLSKEDLIRFGNLEYERGRRDVMNSYSDLSHWKPSEEQIESLTCILGMINPDRLGKNKNAFDSVTELYNDLKNLM